VQSECPAVSLGRMWNNAPQCVYLNTIFDESAGKFSLLDTRWTPELMSDGNNGDKPWPGKAGHIGEFNTLNTEGQVISPASNVVKFTRSGESRDYETILKSDEAAQYTPAYVLGDWNTTAIESAKQIDLTYKADGTWNETSAKWFLVEENGQASIVDALPAYKEGLVVRAANARGGFGRPAYLEGTDPDEGIETVSGEGLVVRGKKIIRDGQLVIIRDGKEYNAFGASIN